MGEIKEWIHNVDNENFYKDLSSVLRIEYDDLQKLEWELLTKEDAQGHIYSYIIKFSDDSPQEILDKVIRLKPGNILELSPWELDDKFNYDEQFEAITGNKENVGDFVNEIVGLELLMNMTMPDNALRIILYRQVYIGVIGALETFLSDVFINKTFGNKEYFKNFIETHPHFSKQKFELRTIFKKTDELETIAKKIMLDTIYHNLPQVRRMYEDSFKISFPSIENLYKMILKRHDLVHRGGRTKAGDKVEVDEVILKELIQETKNLISAIVKSLDL